MMAPELVASLQQWVTETDSVLQSVERLVEYFGKESELDLLQQALAVPRFWFDTLADVAHARKDPFQEASRVDHVPVAFDCEHDIARMITPLLILIVEPVPEFVEIVRATAEPELRSAILLKFGMMSGELSNRICRPLWDKYAELKPEGFR